MQVNKPHKSLLDADDYITLKVPNEYTPSEILVPTLLCLSTMQILLILYFIF